MSVFCNSWHSSQGNECDSCVQRCTHLSGAIWAPLCSLNSTACRHLLLFLLPQRGVYLSLILAALHEEFQQICLPVRESSRQRDTRIPKEWSSSGERRGRKSASGAQHGQEKSARIPFCTICSWNKRPWKSYLILVTWQTRDRAKTEMQESSIQAQF